MVSLLRSAANKPQKNIILLCIIFPPLAASLAGKKYSKICLRCPGHVDKLVFNQKSHKNYNENHMGLFQESMWATGVKDLLYMEKVVSVSPVLLQNHTCATNNIPGFGTEACWPGRFIYIQPLST